MQPKWMWSKPAAELGGAKPVGLAYHPHGRHPFVLGTVVLRNGKWFASSSRNDTPRKLGAFDTVELAMAAVSEVSQ